MFKSWMWKQRSYREQAQGDEGGASAGGGSAQGGAEDAGADSADASGDAESQGGDQSATTPPAEAEGHLVVTIGDEAAPEGEAEPQAAPEWLKELRKSDREKSKRIRELEREKAERERAQQPGAINPGVKPTLAGCDFDEEVFETKLTTWHEQQALAKAEQKKKADADKAEQDAWQAKLAGHEKSKAALAGKVPDYDDAEAFIAETMSTTQRAIIVSGADDSALVEYALGKNPAKAKELAAIKDPVRFAFAVAKLETQLKVGPRKTPPPPEKQVRGTTSGATGVDNTLARLEAEADRTGDRSKVAAYRREQRRAAA